MPHKLPFLMLITGILAGCSASSTLDSPDFLPSSPDTTSSISTGDGPAPISDLTSHTAAEQAFPFAEETSDPTDKTSPVMVAMARVEQKTDTSPKRKVYSPKFKDAKPINFGLHSPKPFQVHGVDVSRWQGDIDWKALRKHGANFAYIKATDGGDHLDPNFKKNWDAAEAAGIPRGAYHFFFWCRVAEEQADWFIQNVPKQKGALPPVIDVEWNAHSKTCNKRPSREIVLKKMQVFMDKVERHYGQKPIIYTAPDFYADNLKGQFKDYSFWLRSVAAHPKKVYPGRDWAFWQYSGTGLSHGVSTQIDLNVFNGTEASWHRWLGQRVH